MFLGKAPDNYVFVPKHKSYTIKEEDTKVKAFIKVG